MRTLRYEIIVQFAEDVPPKRWTEAGEAMLDSLLGVPGAMVAEDLTQGGDLCGE